MNTAADIKQSDILDRCVSIDLEVDPEKAKIFAFAAVARDPDSTSLVVKGWSAPTEWSKLIVSA